MADLVDRAESELGQLISRTSSTATRVAGQNLMRFSVHVGKGVVSAPYKAAAAVWNAASQALHPQQGQVSLKAFSRLADGKRELVNLDDRAVSREFERELKRHGVTWARERHRDGTQTFHVEGKDAELIQHALGVAAARVDEKIARRAPELTAEQPKQEQGEQQPDLTQQPGGHEQDQHDPPTQEAPTRDLEQKRGDALREATDLHDRSGQAIDDSMEMDGHEQHDAARAFKDEAKELAGQRDQVLANAGVSRQEFDDHLAEREAVLEAEYQEYAAQHGQTIAAHGTDELREDAPARSSVDEATPEQESRSVTPDRDEAVTDRGGHTEQRSAPAERPTRTLSPRDETREKVAKRIDREVQQKKNTQQKTKTRAKTRTPGREASTEAREAARRR